MSFIRATTTARFAAYNARRYASTSAPSSGNSRLALYGAGAAGVAVAGYLYLGSETKTQIKDEAKQLVKATNTESPLNAKEFTDFKLKRVEPYNWNTTKYVFELPDDQASLLPVASCVVFKGPEELKDAKGKPVIRPYTPTSRSDLPGEFEFIVKRYEGGLMSQHLHTLKPGDKLSIKGPIPKIPWKVNEFDHVGMVAGGSGITPMWQILQSTLADPANKTKYTLLFGNVEERDILLREEFDALAKKYPDTFKVVHVLGTAPHPNWDSPTGFINTDLMKKHFAAPSENVKILVCGPPAQVKAIAGSKEGMKQGPLDGALKELGYKEEQVFKF